MAPGRAQSGETLPLPPLPLLRSFAGARQSSFGRSSAHRPTVTCGLDQMARFSFEWLHIVTSLEIWISGSQVETSWHNAHANARFLGRTTDATSGPSSHDTPGEPVSKADRCYSIVQRMEGGNMTYVCAGSPFTFLVATQSHAQTKAASLRPADITLTVFTVGKPLHQQVESFESREDSQRSTS